MTTPPLLSELFSPPLFQEAIDHLAQGIVCFDPDGGLVFANRRYRELLELPESLLQAGTRKQAIVDFQRERGDFDPPARFFDAAGHTVEPDPVSDEMPDHYWRQSRGGRTLEVQVTRLASGLHVRCFTDVTAYLAAQRQAQRGAARLQRVLDALDPGTWELYPDTGEVEINEAWARLLGYRRQELLPMTGERWRELIHPDDLQASRDVIGAALAGTDQHIERVWRMRHRQGHWVWVRCTDRLQAPWSGDEGAPSLSGTLVDISEKVLVMEHNAQLADRLQGEAAERNRQLERSLQDMAMISSSLAHDLRTPLRSINGYASILAEPAGTVDADTAAAYAGKIAHHSATMGRMISRMLDLLQVLQAQPVLQPLRVGELAREQMQRLCGEGCAVDFVCAETPEVSADPELLRMVLEQLLRNALTYAGQQAQPRVEFGYAAQEQVYFVRDNGIGFDMATADRLFEPFIRLHPGADVDGLGMGLAIASRSVERMGGRLWASSAPGQGSTFYFTLRR